MPTTSDVTVTPLSGLNHIDALLDSGPDWNYLTPSGNTILYTFSVTSGNEVDQNGAVTGQQAFSSAQQGFVRSAMAYISALTGINFTETANGSAAQVHLCSLNVEGSSTSGLCSWTSSYSYDGQNRLTSYEANAYVYLDNVEWRSQNADLSPGRDGYETLLHELGHMLGLKHPFADGIVLPSATDNTANTLMAYTSNGGPYLTFRPYDVAALNWLYGGDGLRGALGINSASGARFITGTSQADTLTGTGFDDMLEGRGGNDLIYGGAGSDTVVFSGTRTSYAISQSANGDVILSGADGTATVSGIESFRFSDGTILLGQLIADTTPPPAPTQSVAKNAAGYVSGNQPLLAGIAEAGSTVQVLAGSSLLGTAHTSSAGFWTLNTAALADGSYTVTSKAIDAAGNMSAASAPLTFKVDIHAPAVPTETVARDGSGQVGGNQPVFSGSAEAGTLVELLNGNTVIGATTAGAGGSWNITTNPVANGNYSVVARSTDAADNASALSAPVVFGINSALNRSGSAANDTLSGSSGNNAIDGGAGIDTAAYAGARASFTITKTGNGYAVLDNAGANGLDTLVNVERIKFGDSALAIDIDGSGGFAYRVYQAAFNRAPDQAGVGYWISVLDAGASMIEVGQGFVSSREFTDTYGALSTVAFVGKLYDNVLHRPAEQGGLDYWVDVIDAKGVSRAQVLAGFSESAENQAQVIGTIQNGFEYIPWVA